MRTYIVSAAISLALILFSSPPVASQEFSELSHYQEVTLAGVSNIRQMIRPVLLPKEAAIEGKVGVEVPTRSFGVGAFASWENDKPLITISAGLPAVLERIAIVYVFNSEPQFKGCADEYADYMFERIIDNSQRKADGIKTLRPVVTPRVYGRQYKGACEGLPSEFTTQAQDLQFRTYMGASIAFIYLHELGHLVKGHLNEGNVSLERRREQEAEADAWAISTGAKAGWELVAAVPIMVFLQGTGGESLEQENKSDHPLGTRRALDMLLQTRRVLEGWNASSASLHNIDAAIEFTKAQLP
jgi:hypothetical protein